MDKEQVAEILESDDDDKNTFSFLVALQIHFSSFYAFMQPLKVMLQAIWYMLTKLMCFYDWLSPSTLNGKWDIHLKVYFTVPL